VPAPVQWGLWGFEEEVDGGAGVEAGEGEAGFLVGGEGVGGAVGVPEGPAALAGGEGAVFEGQVGGVGEAGPVGAEGAVGAVEVVAGEAVEEAAGGEVEVEAILHRMAGAGERFQHVGDRDGLEDEDRVFHIDDEDGSYGPGVCIDNMFQDGFPLLGWLRRIIGGGLYEELALRGGAISVSFRVIHFRSSIDKGLMAFIWREDGPDVFSPESGPGLERGAS